jgi:hypothetical protein
MTTFKFRELVYRSPYAPYYDAYKGHKFVIDHYSKEDDTGQHVWLTCVSDSSILVAGYVELYQLEEVND